MFHNAHLYPSECIRELLLSIPYQDCYGNYHIFIYVNQLSSPSDRATITAACIQLINEWCIQHPDVYTVQSYDMRLMQYKSSSYQYELRSDLSSDDEEVCFIMFTLMQKLYCDIH